LKRGEDTFVILDQASGYLQLDILEASKSKFANQVLVAGSVVERSVKLEGTSEWEKIIAYDRSSTRKRVWTWVVGTFQMFWIVARKYRKSQILSITNPPLSIFVPWLLGRKFEVLVYDVYPDALVQYGYLKPGNPFVRVWRKLNKRVFAKAKKVYTLSAGMKSLLEQYVESDKIEIVPIWTDNDFIQPVLREENLFLKDQEFADKFIIAYSGNMGKTHPVEVLLAVAKKLDPALFQVVLVGGGDKFSMIEKALEKEPIPNVRMFSWQPVEKLPHVLSAADVSVVTLDQDASALSVPSKTFNILSVGNPILAIASPDSELKRLLDHYQCGETFSSDNTDEMVSFVKDLQTNSDAYRQMASNSLEASKDFNRENAKLFFD